MGSSIDHHPPRRRARFPPSIPPSIPPSVLQPALQERLAPASIGPLAAAAAPVPFIALCRPRFAALATAFFALFRALRERRRAHRAAFRTSGRQPGGHLVESAQIVVSRVAEGGRADAARAPTCHGRAPDCAGALNAS